MDELIRKLAWKGYTVHKNKSLIKVIKYYNKLRKPISMNELAKEIGHHWIIIKQHIDRLGITKP